MKQNHQSLVFRGIYEFEDPSGCLVAARVPHAGSADLFADTAVIVRPNQSALFIYKGKIADHLGEGTHHLKTENVPVLTRLANWKFGFKSPLRCEIWFFSKHVYPSRRWGTAKPVLHNFDEMKAVPIRAYGNYNVVLKDPQAFFSTLVGSRSSYDISELEEFVQGQILELLPNALDEISQIGMLNGGQQRISQKLEAAVNRVLRTYGLEILDLQILSLLPSDEVLKALNTKVAMDIIGDKREFLLYQAANSLTELADGKSGQNGNDPMQMMMGLMLGKSLLDADFKQKEKQAASKSANTKSIGGVRFCNHCRASVRANDKFCFSCGGKL